jgi:hypothetical protein
MSVAPDVRFEMTGFRVAGDKGEIQRRIARLIFIIYWLLIFEGALRKWVFPEYQQILFFIRDPFVLIVYWIALRHCLWSRSSHFLVTALGLIFSAVSLLWIFVSMEFASSGSNLLLAAYGWRNYFYYIPLGLIIGTQFRMEDLHRLVRQTLIVAIPIAVLVLFQAQAPATAAINQGISDDPQNTFGNLSVSRGVVRTHGTFTSSVGQSLFIASAVAMLAYAWLAPEGQRPLRGFTLMAATGAVVVNLALSGSRGAFVLAAIVLLCVLLAGLVSSRPALWCRTITFLITLGIAGAFSLDIPSFNLEAFAERAAGAAEGDAWWSYGIVNRGLGDFVHFLELLPDAPLVGYGMGLGGNASTKLGGTLSVYAEDDWSRHIVDLGPILGVLFIVFRIMLVTWLARGAIVATRRSGHPLPLCLFGFIGIILLYGQISGHGSANGYGWLFAGFCIAANRFGQQSFVDGKPLH